MVVFLGYVLIFRYVTFYAIMLRYGVRNRNVTSRISKCYVECDIMKIILLIPNFQKSSPYVTLWEVNIAKRNVLRNITSPQKELGISRIAKIT